MLEQQLQNYADLVNEGILPATIISLVPWKIYETKPGIYPGTFEIEAAPKGEFATLPLGPSVHFVYIDIHRGSYPITDMPYKVGQSVVKDYLDACLSVSGEMRPGIFVVTGAHGDEEIAKKFKKQLAYNEECQINWFKKLVTIADDDWSKFRLHRLITDTQRAAAKWLDMKRDWLMEYTPSNSISCPACGTTIMNTAVVCFACRYIVNPEMYAQMDFANGNPLVRPRDESQSDPNDK